MITVVISSYKYGHLASHCIETILGQSKLPNKILFVDDGAGDCKHLKNIYPEVEFIFRESNIGTVANFQNMLMRVDTEYCMFIGADNWLRSDTIQLFHDVIETENPDIITYDMIITGCLKYTRIRHHLNEIAPFQGDFYWQRDHKHHGSMLYRTSLAKSVGGYAKYGNFHQTLEDLGLWERMIAAGANVTNINQAFLYYRHHKVNNNKY